MRRLARAAATLLLLAPLAAADAHVLELRQAVELWARPNDKRPAAVIAPSGAEVDVLEEGKKWSTVTYEGRRLYAQAAAIAAATPSDQPGPDPTCDYGYPYSGSGLFFARPMARLRHSEPLGFLFGYHRFYPC